jgi:hypothetical protein
MPGRIPTESTIGRCTQPTNSQLIPTEHDGKVVFVLPILNGGSEPVLVNVHRAQKSIPRNRFVSLCSLADTTNMVFVPARQVGSRFLGSLTGN